MSGSNKNALTRQSIDELKKVIDHFLSRRGVSQNPLCGKGVWLDPPHRFSITENDSGFIVSFIGSHNKQPVTHKLNAMCAVIGRFRPEITFIEMSPKNNPIFHRFVPFQPARQKMLNLVEPGAGISKIEFTARALRNDGKPQTDATRRWRELRGEYGFEVEEDGGRYMRGDSQVPIHEPQPRPNQQDLTKVMLPLMVGRGDQKRCNKCERPVCFKSDNITDSIQDDEFPGLIDHRRPVLYGGSDLIENLQYFCQQCNNVKAKICNSCPIHYRCENCSWAFPEKFHDTIVIVLSPEQVQKLEIFAINSGRRGDQIARDIFNNAFANIQL